MGRWALGIAFLAILATVAVAQDDVHIVPRVKPAQPVLSTEAPSIRVNVDLALVPVLVTDYNGIPQSGLLPGHFRLFFDGREEEIRYFSEEDAPISIGLILDRSGSMGWKIDQAKAVIHGFGQQVNPQDEIFMITFADTIDSTDFQNVSDEIDSRMLFVGSRGKTSLLDAVYFGLAKMKDAKYSRRALIIVSDGGDNHSRYTEGEVKRVVAEANTQVFAIGLFNPQCVAMQWQRLPGGGGAPCSQEEMNGPYLLEELAHKGGGLAFMLSDPKDIQDAVEQIGRTLRQEYILGFIPRMKKDSRYHKLKVKLQRIPKGLPPLKVEARQGIYAQSE